MPYYMRRKKVNVNDEDARVDFTDQNGDTWQEYPVVMGAFKDWMYVNGEFGEGTPTTSKDFNVWLESLSPEQMKGYYEESPWYGSTAPEIDWQRRVEIQGAIQKYITHSISSTINLPSDVSEEEVSKIYLESWKKGLKGITVYRDGSRSGVLVANNAKPAEAFKVNDAPKRPKALDGEAYITMIKGIPHNVIIGIMEGKPYEIFIDTESDFIGSGLIIKKKRGVYYFKKGDVSVDISSNMTDEQVAITRLVSTSLRHGADIKFIVEQLNKSDGELFSFTKGLARVLKKYIPDGAKSTVTCNDCGSENVIFQEGCSSCQDCGSSACS